MNTSDYPIADFLKRLASRAPTPGGGGASALIGAVAAALVSMVGNLNDKKTGEHGPLHDTIDRANDLRRRLMRLADDDVAAFTELMACWKLPPEAPDRPARLDAATVRATEAPLAIMAAALDVLRLANEGLEKSKRNCISDAGVAALAAHACIESARLNVMINLPGFKDEAKAADYARKARVIRAEAAELIGAANKRISELYGA